MKILLIEDHEPTAQAAKKGLEENMHTVDTAFDGAEGSFLARSYDYDAIIIDYSLPKKDGIVVCGEIRKAGKNTPILFLSVTDDTETKVMALDRGADDYMTKPYSIDELCARLRVLIRRPQIQELKTEYTVEDLRVDTSKRLVVRGDKGIHLTNKEYLILEYLIKNKGKTITRASIMEHVWTADGDPFSNSIETHIGNIRRKINFNNLPDLIMNVSGHGYIIDTPENLKRF